MNAKYILVVPLLFSVVGIAAFVYTEVLVVQRDRVAKPHPSAEVVEEIVKENERGKLSPPEPSVLPNNKF